MTYLLDTNVLSEVRRPQPDARVLAWLDQVDEELVFLSVVTLAELARGISLLAEGKRKSALADWLDAELRPRFGARLLSLDETTALLWGRLSAEAQQSGRHLSVMDGWIAATAMQHGLALVTRNIKDFKDMGIQLLDPWTNEK